MDDGDQLFSSVSPDISTALGGVVAEEELTAVRAEYLNIYGQGSKAARQQGSSGVGQELWPHHVYPWHVTGVQNGYVHSSSNSTPLHSVYAVEEGKIYLSSLDLLGLGRRSGFPVVISRWPRSYRPTSRITHHHDHHSPPPLDLSPLSTGLFRCLAPQPGRPSQLYRQYPTYPTCPTYLTYPTSLHPSCSCAGWREIGGCRRRPRATCKRRPAAMTLVSCQTDYI